MPKPSKHELRAMDPGQIAGLIKQSGPEYRSFAVEKTGAIDVDARTVEVCFSSETTDVERFYGVEILDHSPESIRMGRITNGAPVLNIHSLETQYGVVENARLCDDRRCRATLRFSKHTAAAEAVFQEYVDGIRQHVSVGYRTHAVVLQEQNDDGPDVYRVTDWEPIEISCTPIGADPNASVGRTTETAETGDKKGFEPMKTNDEEKIETRTVDTTAGDDQAAKRDHDRVAAILALGTERGYLELAADFVTQGKTLSEFRGAVLDRISEEKKNEPSPEIGLTDTEVKDFRLVRLLRALANPKDRAKQESAAFEFDACSAAAEKRHKSPEGMALPADIIMRGQALDPSLAALPFEAAQRAITAGAGGTGQYTVGTTLMPMIQALENALMIKRMGAQVFTGLSGVAEFPKESTTATIYWVGEGEDTTESTPAFAQLLLNPKTAGTFTDLTRRFLLQSSIDAENWLRGHLMRKIACAVDVAAINGTGADGQPLGILNTTGIGDIDTATDGAAVTYADLVNLEAEVAIDNALVGNLAFLTNSSVRKCLRRTLENTASTNSDWIWKGIAADQGEMLGYNAFVTNNMPNDLTQGNGTALSGLIFGNWADLYLGFWSGVDINVDTSALAKSGGVRVVALQDCDVGVAHSESFAAIDDIVTTN